MKRSRGKRQQNKGRDGSAAAETGDLGFCMSAYQRVIFSVFLRSLRDPRKDTLLSLCSDGKAFQV